MKVQILRGIVVQGEGIPIGAVIEVDPTLGAWLIQRGKAEIASEVTDPGRVRNPPLRAEVAVMAEGERAIQPRKRKRG